jgi:hypothetical protein
MKFCEGALAGQISREISASTMNARSVMSSERDSPRVVCARTARAELEGGEMGDFASRSAAERLRGADDAPIGRLEKDGDVFSFREFLAQARRAPCQSPIARIERTALNLARVRLLFSPR